MSEITILKLKRSRIMNWFGGRFVVCVALVMVLSASSFAGDRSCQRTAKTCGRRCEMRCCPNQADTCLSNRTTCNPAATCCHPAATSCCPSGTTCCAEAASTNPTVGVAPTTDESSQPVMMLQPYELSPEVLYWMQLNGSINARGGVDFNRGRWGR